MNKLISIKYNIYRYDYMDHFYLLNIGQILDSETIIEMLKLYNYNEYLTFKANVFKVINRDNEAIEIPEIDIRQWYIIYQIGYVHNHICWPMIKCDNFSYEYFMHHCIKILNQNKYLPYFPKIELIEKWRLQKSIWKQLCQYFNWSDE